MRLLARLLAILAICVVAIALPSAPALAGPPPDFSLTPASAVPGDDLTVYGSNFTPDEYVDIYFDVNGDGQFGASEWVTEALVGSNRNFQATFQVPESCKGTHKVRAEESSTSTIVTRDFTVKPGLTVDPEDGAVGSNVTVEGHGFAQTESDIEVRYYSGTDYDTVLNGIEADDYGYWEETFSVPSSAQGDHRLDATGDTSLLSAVRDATFEVTPSISLPQLWGSPGQNITMTGTGFYAGDRYINILFAGEETQTEIIRADDNGYWQGDFEVPQMPIGTYSITAEGDFTPEGDVPPLSFEIRPGLVLSPASGHVGTELTVTGYGFPINQNVNVLYDGNQVGVAPTNGQGTFQTNFVVPESLHGQRPVTAQGGDNVATAYFAMESVAPGTPELDSPADGGRVGLIGRTVRPTFEWSAVSDESGVYYSLQIATSDNLTSSGFDDPAVSVDNIVGTNYTLENGLSYGSYYWIVQAVDGAGNEGQWTASRSFRAGALPLWAFILAIVVFVALVGTLIYYFIIRKRIYYY
jgi:hypothetical protein